MLSWRGAKAGACAVVIEELEAAGRGEGVVLAGTGTDRGEAEHGDRVERRVVPACGGGDGTASPTEARIRACERRRLAESSRKPPPQSEQATVESSYSVVHTKQSQL